MKISVVIPTHDRDDYLEKAIDSVAQQTHKPVEVVVVDDMRSDSTKQCVQMLREKYHLSVKYIESSSSNGVSKSYNIGEQHAPRGLHGLLR